MLINNYLFSEHPSDLRKAAVDCRRRTDPDFGVGRRAGTSPSDPRSHRPGCGSTRASSNLDTCKIKPNETTATKTAATCFNTLTKIHHGEETP